MATTIKLGEVIKAAKPELALALQQVLAQSPPTRREKEAITQFLALPPRQQNAVVTTHIQHMAQLGRQGNLAATNPTVRHLGQFLFYDDTNVRAARAAPKQNDSRPATRERGASAKQQIDAEMTSIKRQLERLGESDNPSPREIVRAMTRLTQLGKRLEKLSTASRRNSTRRDDSTINGAPTVQPTPTSGQSRRSNADNNKNAIVRALH